MICTRQFRPIETGLWGAPSPSDSRRNCCLAGFFTVHGRSSWLEFGAGVHGWSSWLEFMDGVDGWSSWMELMAGVLFCGENVFNSLPRKLLCLGRFWRIVWIHPFLSNHPGAIHPIIQIIQCKTASAARYLINSSPNTNDELCLFSYLYPSSMTVQFS